MELSSSYEIEELAAGERIKDREFSYSAQVYLLMLGQLAHASSWLDAYAGVAALDFEAGSSKTSETQCRLGFDISAGSLSADVDFSSLVVSAGLAFRF